jgi:ATP-binding cassette subfamily C protein CydD
MVGERGLRLSSGQRQQLALARAFLRDAPLLLLDEPTAHLDAATAARLETALGTLAAGRTVIQVSHTTNHAGSRVLTLDHGQLTQVLAVMPPRPAPALAAAPS